MSNTTNGVKVFTVVVLSGSLFFLIYHIGRRRLQQIPKPDSPRETPLNPRPAKGPGGHHQRYFSHHYEKSYPRISSISEAVVSSQPSARSSRGHTGTNNRYGTDEVHDDASTASEHSDADTPSSNPYVLSSTDAALRNNLENRGKKLRFELGSGAEQSFLDHLSNSSTFGHQQAPSNDTRHISPGDLSSFEQTVNDHKQETRQKGVAGCSTTIDRVFPVAVAATVDHEPQATPFSNVCENLKVPVANILACKCEGPFNDMRNIFREKALLAVCRVQSKCKACVPLIVVVLTTIFKLDEHSHSAFCNIVTISVGFMIAVYKEEEVENWSLTESSLGSAISAFRLAATQNLLQALSELVVIYHSSANAMIIVVMFKEVALLTFVQHSLSNTSQHFGPTSSSFSFLDSCLNHGIDDLIQPKATEFQTAFDLFKEKGVVLQWEEAVLFLQTSLVDQGLGSGRQGPVVLIDCFDWMEVLEMLSEFVGIVSVPCSDGLRRQQSRLVEVVIYLFRLKGEAA
ncbi:hypothetical protein AXG93_1923s1820 [Marchantia polymorpha subsp. ruderalis]|uniref:Uncharacterized protein n=1 Tax=Marchantia polymorpha subsp. ruderalis TaxID=1480154 RepID=A0A176VFC1_MARPO|nr:hypothetical protein AXG93_1923s1820 [Marchantia polymorpha subsp. ruderalis]